MIWLLGRLRVERDGLLGWADAAPQYERARDHDAELVDRAHNSTELAWPSSAVRFLLPALLISYLKKIVSSC